MLDADAPPTPGCNSDAECGATAVCHERTGECIDDADAKFYAPDGSATASCGRADPCSLDNLRLGDDTTDSGFFVIEPGTYTGGDKINLTGAGPYTLSGATRGFDGTIVEMSVLTDRDTQVELEGITFESTQQGFQLRGPATLSHVRVTAVTAPTAIEAEELPVTILDSSIDTNQAVALELEPDASDAGTLDIERTKIVSNTRGGVAVEGNATFVNDLIADNGGNTMNIGGILVAGGMVSIQFTTLADNIGAMASEVSCEGATVSIANSILADSSTESMTSDACGTDETFTLRSRDGLGSDVVADPEFVGHGNYHLMIGSPARGAADPTATNPVDLDGIPRPAGQADLGAYEYTTGSTTRVVGR
jgi:hypothetical protein